MFLAKSVDVKKFPTDTFLKQGTVRGCVHKDSLRMQRRDARRLGDIVLEWLLIKEKIIIELGSELALEANKALRCPRLLSEGVRNSRF